MEIKRWISQRFLNHGDRWLCEWTVRTYDGRVLKASIDNEFNGVFHAGKACVWTAGNGWVEVVTRRTSELPMAQYSHRAQLIRKDHDEFRVAMEMSLQTLLDAALEVLSEKED